MMQFPESFSNIPGRETLARSQVLRRTWPFVLDMCVAGIGLACFYGVVYIAKYWFGGAQPEVVISQSPRALPLYAFFSIVRIGLAYLLSLVFAIGYGYVAAYNKRIEALMIAGLDILQSIPVLSFLPGVMLAMVALFPTPQLGAEMGATLLILTDQLIWRPVIAWSDKFKFEQVESASRVRSPLLHLLQHSRGLRTLRQHTLVPIGEGVYRRLAKERNEESQPSAAGKKAKVTRGRASVLVRGIFLSLLAAAVLYAAWQAVMLLRQVHGSQFAEIMKG